MCKQNCLQEQERICILQLLLLRKEIPGHSSFIEKVCNMYILGELNGFPSLQTVYETNSMVRANFHLTMMNQAYR